MDRVTSEEERVIALLHDVIEDCGVMPDMLLIEHSGLNSQRYRSVEQAGGV